MLVEGEGPNFIKDGFHMTYGWENHHAMNKIAQGKQQPELLDSLIIKDLARYPAGSYFMNFTSNHDENSWNGTEFERMGDAAKTFAVAAATIPGMFLIYSGQEVALDRRLKFFDKDSINWVDNRNYTPFYTTLIEAKKTILHYGMAITEVITKGLIAEMKMFMPTFAKKTTTKFS